MREKDVAEPFTYISTTWSYDALGRVSQTTNPSRPGDGPGFATTYAYDALNRVTHKWKQWEMPQTRSFGYDSRQMLLFAANPESATVSYGYDADSNLKTRVDGRGITTGTGTCGDDWQRRSAGVWHHAHVQYFNPAR